MTVLQCLKKMEAMFATRGSSPEADPHLSSMNHAHFVCKEGIAHAESGRMEQAAYSLGFVQRAMIGMGVFSPKELNSFRPDILSAMEGK